MDGIHDMGGMHGLGPLEPTREEPLSKSDWGLRTFCIELSYTQPGGFKRQLAAPHDGVHDCHRLSDDRLL